MKTFEIRCLIEASPERIWTHLTDTTALVSGGLGLLRLEGDIVEGGRIRVCSEADPTRTFALRVTDLSPARCMVWQGGMPFGLFTGTRRFTLTPQGAATEFHMEEQFSGPLAGLITKSIPDLNPSFRKFADGLRALAERTGTPAAAARSDTRA